MLAAIARHLLPCLLATTVAAADWKLIFSDEFNHDGHPDPAKWDYEHGFVRNKELQWYQPENATCANGLLVIEARREVRANPRHNPASKDWRDQRPDITITSACLITKGCFSFTYGKAEARIRIDTRPGSWPAFWTLSANAGGFQAPDFAEVDTMEYYQNTILANVFYRHGGKICGPAVKRPLAKFGGEAWAKEFHVYTMEWDAERITIAVDGEVLNTFRVSDDDEPGQVNGFRMPHYLLLNQAIGGNCGGAPAHTEFPVRLEVDWVRVYQKNEQANATATLPRDTR